MGAIIAQGILGANNVVISLESHMGYVVEMYFYHNLMYDILL